MTAFISHSFQNRPEFENVVDALEQRGVAYWNPAEIKAGASLREQLRAAVNRCPVCIFVATRQSIASSWCGAELGAFWGAGKPVIVYVAEPSLAEEELPPLVQGDVWERRLARIAERAGEIVGQAARAAEGAAPPRASQVSELSVEQLERLIVGAVSLAAATVKDRPEARDLASVEGAVKGMAGKVLAGFRAAGSAGATPQDWHRQVLWVDDEPHRNVHERHAMESIGIAFTLATSTDEACKILAGRRFGAIISDMGRKEGPREGYVLLEAVREKDRVTPFFIYAGSGEERHKREAAMRGAQGSTNAAAELVEMVARALPRAG